MSEVRRGRPRIFVDIERVKQMADAGQTRAEIAQQLGVHYQTLCRTIRENGVKVQYGGEVYETQRASTSARAAGMAAMYKSGKTLQDIGTLFGITRERVRQLISRHTEVTSSDGGRSIQIDRNRRDAASRKEAKYLAKYGATPSQMSAIRAIARKMMEDGATWYMTPTGAFNQQRSSARARGIEWSMTFWEWWTIWSESGKWCERGRGGDNYVMCRFADQGAYEVGNVYVATLRHNSTFQINNPRRRDHPRHAEWIQSLSKAKRTRTYKQRDIPRGVTAHRNRFVAQITVNRKTKYLGCFKTPEEASDAYEKALAAISYQEAAE